MAGLFITVATSWYLAGLTWTISCVTYPAFALVPHDGWDRYHRAHTRGILFAVGPMWLLEALGVVLWLAAPPPGTRILAAVAAVAIMTTIAVTALGAVPAHAALAARYDARVYARLRRAQLVRTAAWTIAALAAVLALILQLG